MNWKSKLPDTFILGLIAVLLLSFFFPYTINHSTSFPLKDIIYWGVSGIFLLYGLKLDINKMGQDLANWKLHTLIQGTTFLIFPAILFVFYPFFKGTDYIQLWMATFFLAVLPSTVSSSVVMISIAKGNLPAGIFNASISGIIGLIITPLWMSLFVHSSVNGNAFGGIFNQLLYQIIIPVFIGVLLNPLLRKSIIRYTSFLGWFDKMVIFLIVYKSFSAAFSDQLFQQFKVFTILILSFILIVLYFLMFYMIKLFAYRLKFNMKDTITAVFCGAQKSLVHGSVFVTLIITDIAQQSIFLLPIMIYHAFQLFVTSFQARKWARRAV